MINLKEKKDCCGCTACQQICPKRCIDMKEDSEGFLYPSVDELKCVSCGLCDSVCPVLHPFESYSSPHLSFAAKSLDNELVKTSSSGGVFYILASKIIEKGGVVFGACFDSTWRVIHDYAENFEELNKFKGSKYAQSFLGDSFNKVKDFLKEGREVLFSGTPCQVAGLNHFLKKPYRNLTTIDIICHSIASPKVWKDYLNEISKGTVVNSVTFKDKSQGWRSYGLEIKGSNPGNDSFVLVRGTHKENIYMRGFLEDLYTRPSCSSCPARNYTSKSDILLGDCWRIEKYHPDIDDNTGMSVAIILSDKGKQLYDCCVDSLFSKEISYDEVEEHAAHAPITTSTPPHPYRTQFYSQYDANRSIIELISRTLNKDDRRKKVFELLKTIGRRLGLSYIYKLLKC